MNPNQYNYSYTPIGADTAQSSVLSSMGQQPQAQAQQPQKKPDENWFTSLLPTGGSIGGGLGGAALGASIGSIIPGIGTAIGGILGGALGSAGGAAAGKFGENAMTGQQDLGNGVGDEALSAGVLGLIGGGIGGAAAKIGGKAAGNAATNLFKGQAPVSAMTSDIAQAGLKYGRNSPQDMAKLGKVITGDASQEGNNALLSKFVRDTGNQNFTIADAAGGKVPIDISDFAFPATTAAKTSMQSASVGGNNVVKNALLDSNLLGSKAQTTLQKEVQGIYENASQQATAAGGTTFDRGLAMQRAFSQRASDLMEAASKNTTGSTVAKDQAKFYQSLSNTMKDRLGLATEGPNAITLSKQQLTDLADTVHATGAGGAKEFADELRKLPEGTTLGTVRSMEAPFAGNSKAIQQLENADNRSNGKNISSMLGSAGVGTGVGMLTNPAIGLGAGAVTKALSGSKASAELTGLLNRFSNLTPAQAAKGVGVPAAALGTLANAGSTNNQQGAGIGVNGMNQENNGAGATGNDQAISSLYDRLLQQYLAAPTLDNGTSSNLMSVLSQLAPRVQASQELNHMTNGLGMSYLNNQAPSNFIQGIGNLVSQNIPGTAANQFSNQRNLVGNLYSELYGVNPNVSTGALPNLLQGGNTATTAAGNYSGLGSL